MGDLDQVFLEDEMKFKLFHECSRGINRLFTSLKITCWTLLLAVFRSSHASTTLIGISDEEMNLSHGRNRQFAQLIGDNWTVPKD